MGYLRSAWYADCYRWVCIIGRICMICGIFVWSGGSVKSGYYTLTYFYSMFSRDEACMRRTFHRCVSEWDLCDHFTSLSGGMCMICRIGMICRIFMTYLSKLWDLNDSYIYLNLDAVCTICRACMIWSISVWSGESVVVAGYFTLLEHVQPMSLYEVDISHVCTWAGTWYVWYVPIYVWSAGSVCSVHTCELQDLYDLPDCVESVWSVWSVHLERDGFCMICMIHMYVYRWVCRTFRNCMICRICNIWQVCIGGGCWCVWSVHLCRVWSVWWGR